jgi:outer membrane protein assembly factor BamB
LALHKQDHGLTAIKPGGKDNVTDTHILWQEKRNVAEVPSPLYYDGRVYMIKKGGLVSCMNAKTGKLLFRERLGAFGPYYSSPITAHGRIYIASGKGIVTVFALGDTLEVLAKNDLKEQIFATPAVVDNKLYVRTVKHMYAFGE